jgi:hypothetical protein
VSSSKKLNDPHTITALGENQKGEALEVRIAFNLTEFGFDQATTGKKTVDNSRDTMTETQVRESG